MKLLAASLLIVLSTGVFATHASAQSLPTSGGLALDLGATYTTIHSNEGPGQCGCFYMGGGSVEFSVKNEHNVSFVTSFSGTHADNINAIEQTLTLFTLLEGVRYTIDHGGRFAPFGEASVGFVHTTSNYILYKDTSAAAAQVGAGIDLRVSRRFSVRPAQVDYLFTSSPNGQNNFQNEIRYGAGIIYHLNASRR
jgi:hypothetical protein